MADAKGAQRFLKVTPTDLTSKATELTSGYPTQLVGSPLPPCLLTLSGMAAQILVQSHERLTAVVKRGAYEAEHLAERLRTAAKAYEDVDRALGEQIKSGQPSGADAPALPPPLSTGKSAPDAPSGGSGAPSDDGVAWETAVEQFDALDGAIVRTCVADARTSEIGVEFFTGFAFERESVILRGDGNTSGGVFDHRDVHASVAELHLVGRASERATEDLVAEADTEQRQLPGQYLAGQGDVRIRCRRVPWAVGQEDSVGIQVENLLDAGGGGDDVDADTALGEHAWGVRLDTEVDCDDREAGRVGRLDGVTDRRRDLTGQIGTEHRRLVEHLLQHLVLCAEGVTGEHSGTHGAAAAEVSN